MLEKFILEKLNLFKLNFAKNIMVSSIDSYKRQEVLKRYSESSLLQKLGDLTRSSQSFLYKKGDEYVDALCNLGYLALYETPCGTISGALRGEIQRADSASVCFITKQGIKALHPARTIEEIDRESCVILNSLAGFPPVSPKKRTIQEIDAETEKMLEMGFFHRALSYLGRIFPSRNEKSNSDSGDISKREYSFLERCNTDANYPLQHISQADALVGKGLLRKVIVGKPDTGMVRTYSLTSKGIDTLVFREDGSVREFD